MTKYRDNNFIPDLNSPRDGSLPHTGVIYFKDKMKIINIKFKNPPIPNPNKIREILLQIGKREYIH